MILKDISTYGVFKLHEGDNPNGMLGRVIRNAQPRTNAGKMSVSCVISTDDEDRSGDVVHVKGIKLDDHRKNPIALFSHNRDTPIGRTESRLGQYTVRVRNDRELVGEIYFNQSSEFAHDIFRCVEDKMFQGVSIGFLPILGMIQKKHDRGTIYKACNMVECSVLPIGDNPNAVIEAVHKTFGGRPICEPLLNMLKPLVPERRPVVRGGFSPAPTTRKHQPKRRNSGMRIKAMDDQLQAGIGTDGGPDEFAPPDGLMDSMKPGAQFIHSLHDAGMQLVELCKMGKDSMDSEHAAKACSTVEKWVGKMMAKVSAIYSDYQSKHPDQPDLPTPEPSATDDSIPDDDEEFGDEDEDDLDIGDDTTDADDSDDKPKKKSLARHYQRYSRKCLEAYWTAKSLSATLGNRPAVEAALRFCKSIAGNPNAGMGVRKDAAMHVKGLSAALVTKGDSGPTADDWNISPSDLESIQKKVDALTVTVKGITS